MSNRQRQEAVVTSRSDLLCKTVNQLVVPADRLRRGSTSSIEGEVGCYNTVITQAELSSVAVSGRSGSSSDVSRRGCMSRDSSPNQTCNNTPFAPTRDSASLWQLINSEAISSHQQNNLDTAADCKTRDVSSRSHHSQEHTSWNVKPRTFMVEHPSHQLLRDRSLSAPEKHSSERHDNSAGIRQIYYASNARVKWSSYKRPAVKKPLCRADTSDYIHSRPQVGRVLNCFRYASFLEIIIFHLYQLVLFPCVGGRCSFDLSIVA